MMQAADLWMADDRGEDLAHQLGAESRADPETTETDNTGDQGGAPPAMLILFPVFCGGRFRSPE
jgi:hypothetical protein